MIDLAADIDGGESPLQTALVVDGAEVPIETGFRAWLRFGRLLDEEGVADPRVLLDPAPPRGWAVAAADFYRDEQPVPRSKGGGGRRAVDFETDAPLIVAAFRQAYGIDLTDPGTDMHWHVFLALFRGLPSETLMAQVMGWRTWSAADGRRRPETAARERRDAWALPTMSGRQMAEALAYQMYWLGEDADTGGVGHG